MTHVKGGRVEIVEYTTPLEAGEEASSEKLELPTQYTLTIKGRVEADTDMSVVLETRSPEEGASWKVINEYSYGKGASLQFSPFDPQTPLEDGNYIRLRVKNLSDQNQDKVFASLALV